MGFCIEGFAKDALFVWSLYMTFDYRQNDLFPFSMGIIIVRNVYIVLARIFIDK